MTLYKQLVVGMITVFVLLMASVFVIEFNTTRNSLEQQQRSEMNNTINTVGLALAPYLKDKDKVAVESVINALFDGSSYSVVRLIFLDSGEEIIRTYPIQPSSVPTWFSQLNLFQRIHDQRIVTSGWLQLAEVEIVSHPGAAYEQLWKALMRLLTAFAGVFFIGLLSISYILKRSLKPLTAIINKMNDIANNKFGDPLAENAPGGVAVLNAEYIGEVYDNKDYQSADRMVAELAKQLDSTISIPGATLARISSDEFGLIFPHMDESELKIVADSIVNCVNMLNTDPTGTADAKVALGIAYIT